MRSFIHFCISEINFTSLHIWTFQSFLTFVNALNGPLKITIKYIKIMAHLKKIFLKLFCNKLLFTWIGMCCYVEKCQMGWSVYDTMNRSNWKSYLDLPNFGKCSLETTSILLFSYIYLKIHYGILGILTHLNGLTLYLNAYAKTINSTEFS